MALLPAALCGSCDIFRGSLVVMNVPWPFIYLVSPLSPQPPFVVRVPATPAEAAKYPMGVPYVLQPPLPPQEHLEIWAMVGDPKAPTPRRVVADVGGRNSDEEQKNFPGFDVVLGINPNDPCMIRGLDQDDEYCRDPSTNDPVKCGSILGTKESFDLPEGASAADINGVQLTLQRRIRQVSWKGMPFYSLPLQPAPVLGLANQPLLALVKRNREYLSDPRLGTLSLVTPQNAADPTVSTTRLATCRNYVKPYDRNGDGTTEDWEESRRQSFYVGNPFQYTKPLSGTLYGFFAFRTDNMDQSGKAPTDMAPTQIYSGISFTVPWAAEDIQGMLITRETTESPTAPSARVVIAAQRTPDSVAGRGTIRMQALGNPQISCPQPPCAAYPPGLVTAATFAGTVTIITDLDSRLE